MRYPIIAAAALALAACATQEAAPARQAAAPAAKAPQCWSGDHGRFFDVGARTTISGVDVSCEKTTDGKSAQWMGKKH
ncbi:MAG: hypothetical protein H3C26_11585 [Rhodocyclaceae bacterium]|nr:hypothetical protein [Rhodocyclaceae bacterium]